MAYSAGYFQGASMVLQKEKFHLDRLDRVGALRYMGIQGELPEEILPLMEEAEAQLYNVLRPSAVWEKVALSWKDGVPFVRAMELSGRDLPTLLEGAKEAVLLAATLGGGVDGLVRRLQIRDRAMAVAVDALASAAVEQVVDLLESRLIQEYAEQGLFLTDRFSPGYGDLPLALQGEFLQQLDATRQIGLGKTGGDLMTPIKSVTAILGVVSNAPTLERRSCDTCILDGKCSFRKNGGYCGKRMV